MVEGKSVQNFKSNSKKVREWSGFLKGGKTDFLKEVKQIS